MRARGRATAPLLGLALALFGCAAHGRQLRVGADARGGSGARVRPAELIRDAMRVARPGDTVLLSPGVYQGDVWIEASGEPGRPIVLRGEGPLGAVVIEGGGETLNIGGGAHDLVIENLEVRRSGDNLIHVQDGAARVTLRDLRVHDAGDEGDGIKVNQARDITIERVECYRPGRRPEAPGGNPAQECIDLVDVERAVVQDCYLHDGGNMLLYAKGGSRDVVFRRNVVAGQGSAAIDPCVGLGAWTDRELLRGRGYEAEHVLFEDNVVVGCRAGAVGVYDARRVWIEHNTLVDNGPVAVQFRAGNAPREESRDVVVLANLLADTRGALRTPLARHSHSIANLVARANLYWNGPRGAVFDAQDVGLSDPAREPEAAREEPGLPPPPLGARATRASLWSWASGARVADRGARAVGAGRASAAPVAWPSARAAPAVPTGGRGGGPPAGVRAPVASACEACAAGTRGGRDPSAGTAVLAAALAGRELSRRRRTARSPAAGPRPSSGA